MITCNRDINTIMFMIDMIAITHLLLIVYKLEFDNYTTDRYFFFHYTFKIKRKY